MLWLEQDRVTVAKVGVVLDLIECAHVLERIRIMIHLSHVEILEHGP